MTPLMIAWLMRLVMLWIAAGFGFHYAKKAKLEQEAQRARRRAKRERKRARMDAHAEGMSATMNDERQRNLPLML